MKLYLSSYKIGDKPEILVEWIKKHGNNILLIANSRDNYSNENKQSRIEVDRMELEKLGFTVKLLDLRDYFDKNNKLEKVFTKVKAFYVIGGNTFILRKAMKLSGFDKLLCKYMSNHDYIYAGYSAGSCVLSKKIEPISFLDNPEEDPYDSGLLPIHEGIGFINETIIPHFETNPKYAEHISKAIKFCEQNEIKYITLRDGETIVLDV